MSEISMRGHILRLGHIADGLTRRVENMGAGLSQALFEPVVRLGVTGLARSGKTVFITSLIANLLQGGRMPQLRGVALGRVEAVMLQPQPDLTLPRFAYETHLSALTADQPHWPQSTRAISELRLSFLVRPTGLMGAVTGPRRVHLDIVDYPGEWLLDLALLGKTYGEWSAQTLARLASHDFGAPFLAALRGIDGMAPLDEPLATQLAAAFTTALSTAHQNGFADCTPGRFLLPGDLAGSPALTFAPLPPAPGAPRTSLWHQMERRYNAYKSKVVTPFFRDHFSRIDRQIVLADVLGAIHSGPQAVEDLRHAMAGVMTAFRPGHNRFLAPLLGGRRVERILFAATKADHLHHSQHARLSAITERLMAEATARARFAGALTQSIALAGLRVTVEETHMHNGEPLECVRGTLSEGGAQAAFFPGDLPQDPARILSPAQQGDTRWLDGDYAAMAFAPAKLGPNAGPGLPHIRLDRAAEFLFGDRLL